MTREQYIPFDKEFLVEKQLEAFAGNAHDAESFSKLFDILEHYFHYEAFALNQQLKRHYALYDPDMEENERKTHAAKSNYQAFKATMFKVLERSKYSKVDDATLAEALKDSDLIGLNLAIDFNAFDDFGLFVRGRHKATERVPRYYLWTKELEIEYYERVMVYLRYKDAGYFASGSHKGHKQAIEPGTVILKVFKRVPVNDLETVFPNAVPKMSTTDKLLFWVPAVGGGISLLSTKVIPALVDMYKAYQTGEAIDLLNSKTSLNHGLIALGVLGAYLFRQYSSFINKKIKYSKMLSDSLYFKNLGNNSGVFHSLINSSEEEELKETILAYAFLNRSNVALTAVELDLKIEAWFRETLHTELDFDVEDALLKLKNIGIGQEADGKWTVLPLDQALVCIDSLWDNIFSYNV